MIPPNGMSQVIEVYGNNRTTELSKGNCMGDPSWENENLIILRNVCATGKSVQLHHLVSKLFLDCFAAARAKCPTYQIRQLGGYCARHQRNDPTLPLSIHSYGAAFDINWDTNPMSKKLTTDIPQEFIEAFTSKGWVWGGKWKNPDPMHFQFASGC